MKNFSIFRNTNKKEGSTAPDYKMSMKVGEKYEEIGACWLKDGKSGKFMSCKLSDAYVDHTKNIAKRGFEITAEDQTETAESYEAESKIAPLEDGGIAF